MSTEFAFFSTALMILLYLAGVLAVVVIGACVLPSVIRQRPRRAQRAAKHRQPDPAERKAAA
jgi:Flp pilus assembly protein TadB